VDNILPGTGAAMKRIVLLFVVLVSAFLIQCGGSFHPAALAAWKRQSALYEGVLGLAPRYPDVWFNKALAEEKLGRIADAVHSYGQLILIGNETSSSQVESARKRLSELRGGLNV
jgi:hypothetical protein